MGIGIGYWAYRPRPEAAAVTETVAVTAPAPVAAAVTVTSSPAATATASSPKAVPVPADLSPSFIPFLESEASQLESTRVDADAAEQRVKEAVKRLTPAELHYARDVALATTGPANHKIVSAYLIAQSIRDLPSESAAYAAALEGAGALVKKTGSLERAPEHSVQEVQNAQAKAFASMSVEAIAERAGKDPQARRWLEQMAQQATDPLLRKIIQEKLHSLPAL